MLKNIKVRRGCKVPSPLIWPSTKKSDGTETSATTGSVDGCCVLPEIQLVRTRLRVDTTQALYVGVPFPMGDARVRPKFDIKPPMCAPLLQALPSVYLLKCFSQGDTSADSGGLKSDFPLS